jgi:hypothetical protein
MLDPHKACGTFSRMVVIEPMVGTYVPALRSVGPGATTVAARTGAALTTLRSEPGVHLVHGVRTAGARASPVVHAVLAGRLVVLVTGVVWPAGDYRVDPDGCVHCDGVYIGQSVQPLRDAVRIWSERLPGRHKVGAMVVVHPDGPGGYTLPGSIWRDLDWSLADSAVDRLRSRFASSPGAASGRALDALTAATDGHGGALPPTEANR